jgi:hypothetical protein
MVNYQPRPGYGLLSEEPCSACGKRDKWMKRGWCAACYQRWDNNGRPDSGPIRIYRPRGSATGSCPVCGEDGWIGVRGWCMNCQTRWRAAGSPQEGPPPKRPRGGPPLAVGECPICGRTGKLRRQDPWCNVCQARWRAAGFAGTRPEPAIKPIAPKAPKKKRTLERDLDKLARLRVMWALTWPGRENPYECIAPGCHETGDPSRRYRCAMHETRLRFKGTYEGHTCLRCGDDFKAYGGWRALCDLCRESWGYCGDPLHTGDRLVSRDQMVRFPGSRCKPCINRYQRSRRRSRRIPAA